VGSLFPPAASSAGAAASAFADGFVTNLIGQVFGNIAKGEYPYRDLSCARAIGAGVGGAFGGAAAHGVGALSPVLAAGEFGTATVAGIATAGALEGGAEAAGEAVGEAIRQSGRRYGNPLFR
jgi:hypothetical protein